MILVADSGSTKTSWIALARNGQHIFQTETQGLNPGVFTKETLYERVMGSKDLAHNREKVEKIFFYGAGCGTDLGKKVLAEVFKTIFTKADIHVHEDTLAAAKALQSDDPAIICILGTGSNCSYYDGEVLHQKVISLGYIIMDDASGNYYGRQLLRDYYYNKMPHDLAVKFASEHDLSAETIVRNLYKEENPNTYLAELGKFIILNKDNAYGQKVILEGLRAFTENHILQFEESKVIPVSFVGSIAHFLKDEIKIVMKEYGLKLGKIVRHPILSVAEYHIKHL